MSFKSNSLSNLAGPAIPMVACVALIWALLGYFTVVGLGVSRVLTVQLNGLGVSGFRMSYFSVAMV